MKTMMRQNGKRKGVTRADEGAFFKRSNEACWVLRCRFEYLGKSGRSRVYRALFSIPYFFSATATSTGVGSRKKSTKAEEAKRPTRGPGNSLEGTIDSDDRLIYSSFLFLFFFFFVSETVFF